MTLTNFIITAIFVIWAMEEGRNIFNALLRKLQKGRFYVGVTTLEVLVCILAMGMTVSALTLLEQAPISFLTQLLLLLLPNSFVFLLIISLVPVFFVVIYGLIFSYTYLEGLTAREQVKRFQTEELKACQQHPRFKEVYTSLYIQITFIFMEKYNHAYVVSSLNRDLRELIILDILSQMLKSKTMDELAETPKDDWDRNQLGELLFNQGFGVSRRSLGLHANRHFARLSTIIQHNHLVISLIRVRKKIDRLKPKGR